MKIKVSVYTYHWKEVVSMETNLTFSEILEDALHNKHMRKADLAKRIGVGKSAITKWCSGDTEPRLSQLSKLAKELDIDFNHYFGICREKLPSGDAKEILSEVEKMNDQQKETILRLCYFINEGNHKKKSR